MQKMAHLLHYTGKRHEMRNLLIFLGFCIALQYGAKAQTGDTIPLPVKDSQLKINADTGNINIQNSSADTIVTSSSNTALRIDGDDNTRLLHDDPAYNPKYAWWIPAVRVVMADVTTWAVDHYVFKYDWSDVNRTTWKYNIQHGFEFDNDKFGVNFIGHPYSGSMYF